MKTIAFSLAVFTSLSLFLTRTASADETPSPVVPATQPTTTTEATATPKPEEDPPLKRVGITVNPLGILIGRYSLQGDIMVIRHLAVTVNPVFTHVPVTIESGGQEFDAGSLTGFGGELGVRFYSSKRGPEGFFVGPSFLFSTYSQSAPSGTAPAGSAGSDSFLGYGGAIDLGGQAIIGPGIVFGGGFGLQYTTTNKDIATDNFNLASAIVAGGGIRPRFLLSLGFAF